MQTLPLAKKLVFWGYTTSLVREDLKSAYPVVNGIPILLIPEVLENKNDQREIDMNDPRYSEAYEEMDHYNQFSIKELELINNSEAYS